MPFDMFSFSHKVLRKLIKRTYCHLNIILYPSFFCNYECPYCVIKASNRLEDYPKESEHKWQEWVDVLNEFPPASISISGGETLLYPGLFSLLDRLDIKHLVSLTTNLYRVPERLLDCRRRKTLNISASFHPSMTDYESFKDRVSRVKGRGFIISVEIVAYPSQLNDLTEYKKRFEEDLGVDVHIDPYITPLYQYTDKEFGLLNQLGIRNRKVGFDFKGSRVLKWCKAGLSHVLFVPNGDAYACHAGFYYATSPLHSQFRVPHELFWMGNVFDKTFTFSEKSRNCSLPCSEACDLEGARVKEISSL